MSGRGTRPPSRARWRRRASGCTARRSGAAPWPARERSSASLALTETKGFAAWLVAELEARLPGYAEHLRIHVTGCPNSCGQHWIADVGIEGKKIRSGGVLVDAYYFCVGGALGLHQATARPVGYRCRATEVPAAIERLLRAYVAGRAGGENFRAFAARHGEPELRCFLAGEDIEAALRDPSPGRLPHGAE